MTTATSPAGNVTRPVSGSCSLVNAQCRSRVGDVPRIRRDVCRPASQLDHGHPGSSRASRSRRGEDLPRGERAEGENGYRQAGRRSQQQPPDRRTYAYASVIPVKAPGAPIHHDSRPRAALSVATVGRGSAGGPQFSTMAAAEGHHPCGIRPSTTGAARVPAAPAVRSVRRRGC